MHSLTIFLFAVIFYSVCGSNGRVKENVKGAKGKDILNFFAGGIAGTISSSVTAPLEVIKTQLQSSTGKTSAIGVCKEIMKTEGIKGFYRGLTPLLVS